MHTLQIVNTIVHNTREYIVLYSVIGRLFNHIIKTYILFFKVVGIKFAVSVTVMKLALHVNWIFSNLCQHFANTIPIMVVTSQLREWCTLVMITITNYLVCIVKYYYCFYGIKLYYVLYHIVIINYYNSTISYLILFKYLLNVIKLLRILFIENGSILFDKL